MDDDTLPDEGSGEDDSLSETIATALEDQQGEDLRVKAIRKIVGATRKAAKEAFLVAHPDFLRRTVKRRVDLITAP